MPEGISEAEFTKTIRKFDDFFREMSKVIVGQDDVLKQILASMMCGGNALLESYPGLGKTLMVRTIAAILDLKFARVQNTPDLLPSDIIGTYIIEEQAGKKVFKFQPGPIFANIILADEINRATPKTQSALLEAMQERQITVGTETFRLDLPFYVLATQNPIDQEGTYPLPEAQIDRFLFKIMLTYPSNDQEMEIVERYASSSDIGELKKVMDRTDMMRLQELTRMVPISNDLKNYTVQVVTKTRQSKNIEYGASPRASIGLILASKANALLNKRNYVTKKDIQEMAFPVLRHRIVLSFKAEKEGIKPDDAIKELL
ncbi:MAG: MoxR family ATPase [Candidatus Aenigmarchaeota archaeon]|nr:MoxR family ATPase [Candidatus Aenigmarchaeota archaeon]